MGRKTMGLEDFISGAGQAMRNLFATRNGVAALAFGAYLTLSAARCGPDHPNGNTDACVAECTSDAGSDGASDGLPDGSPDGSEDASSDAPGDADAGSDDGSTACTRTPVIHFKTMPAMTYDTTTQKYIGQPGTYTLDFCESVDAERYKVQLTDGINLATILEGADCAVDHTFTSPKEYSVLVTAFNDTCATDGTATYPVVIQPVNQPPVARAGPDMTVQKGKGYCFNFSNNDANLFVRCGNAPFAPGHSTQGTGSYDPDGTIAMYTIWQRKENVNEWQRNSDGKRTLVYGTAGTFTLLLETKDNQGTTSTDEAIITVTE